MDPRRAKTERNMLPAVGPAFYREGDEVMFEFVVDASNVIGPRPATRADQERHAGAWAAFSAVEGVSALDRDASGGVGGSLPQESPAVPVQGAALHAFPETPICEQDYQPGDLVGGSAKAEAAPEPKPKRKYTRRQKG